MKLNDYDHQLIHILITSDGQATTFRPGDDFPSNWIRVYSINVMTHKVSIVRINNGQADS